MTDLSPLLKERLAYYDNVCRQFDPVVWTDSRIDAIHAYMQKCNKTTFVVSVSGGIDSATVLAILSGVCKKYPDVNYKVIGLAQPIHSTPEIQNRAYEVASTFGIELLTFNLTEVFDLQVQIMEKAQPLSNWSKSMMKSYMRTPTAFAVASNNNGLVVGTGNMDEDGYLFYYCKFGDGAVDIGIIHDLHKCDVFAVGQYLGVPESILIAPPSADLYENQTDETEIGCSYDAVRLVTAGIYSPHVLTTHNKWFESLHEDDQLLYTSMKQKIDAIHQRGKHKQDLNPTLIR